ncbi:hypothetical protein EYF80_037465 [Liparis tanakae]|uniref:Uncharacterized protein n=1 Tax=Liparis tanakae TaxID=230148 RepID=A0A4Z2GGG2_9TELE|nr:hypothetical protein EYF80_037465 [Liparis tanakae]
MGCSQSFCQFKQSLRLFPGLDGVVPVPAVPIQDDLAADCNTLPLISSFQKSDFSLQPPGSVPVDVWSNVTTWLSRIDLETSSAQDQPSGLKLYWLPVAVVGKKANARLSWPGSTRLWHTQHH